MPHNLPYSLLHSLVLWTILLLVVTGLPTQAASLQHQVLFDFSSDAPDTRINQQSARFATATIRDWRSDSSFVDSRAEHYVAAESAGHKALRFAYRLTPGAAIEVGVRLPLNGLNASPYDHLQLRLRGDSQSGFAPQLKLAFTRPDTCGDSAESTAQQPGMQQQTASYTVQNVSETWQSIRIPLNQMNGITDWSCLQELVISQHARRTKQPQGTYWIDDIRLLHTGQPGPHVWDRAATPKKAAWMAKYAEHEPASLTVRERLQGWPTDLSIDGGSLPRDQREFLQRLAKDTWQGIHALSDREHGLPMNNVLFAGANPTVAQARIGDYVNVTDIGLYLMSIAAAHQLQLLERSEALQLLRTTLKTLNRLERHQGFFYNYYDTTTLERSSNFISLVDSGWLTAGLMVVRNAFAEVAAECSALIEAGDYRFFYDPVYRLMSHGYYTHLGAYSEYHYGLLYTEARLASLVAIGKGDVPPEHWYALWRTFPEHDLWQSLPPQGRQRKQVNGHSLIGGYYQLNGKRFLPSWGGSMFEALMPTLVMDEQTWAPPSLGVNNRVHTEFQRDYALHQVGYPVWGMSPSAQPPGDRYAEFGVRFLGTKGYPAGAVTPHASALALATHPDAAIDNLRKLTELYPMYTEYGLFDSVNPANGEIASSFIVLDQAMTLLALTNYLQEGAIQRWFAQDPIATAALPLLQHERFFDAP